MVQEVQTSVNQPIETTLETIQAVGTSSVKIVEGRQTTWGRFAYWCKASWNKSMYAPDTQQITLTISSSYWNTEFLKVDGGIRIPLAWAYEIVAECRWGNIGWWVNFTHYIKSWDTDLFNVVTSNNNDTITSSKTVNLGKFDIVKVISKCGWTAWNGAVSYDTITITKL